MQIDLRKFAVDAMDEAIANYSVGIPALSPTGPVIGTGVAIELNGKRFILTAAHHAKFIEPATIEVFVRPPGSLARINLGDTPTDKYYQSKNVLHVLNRISDEDLDFSLLELDSGKEMPIGLSFLDSRVVTDVPAVGQVVTILGHPAQLSERLNGSMAVHRMFAYERVEEVGRFRNHNPETHFQLSFEFGQRHTEGGFRAGGLSGAGVWVSEPKCPASGLWIPKPHLIGIVTHAIHAAPFALAGTKIKKIVEALAGERLS